MMNNNAIKVNCKKCGRPANSTEFVLDAVYKMMVCPNCIKDRRMSEIIKNEVKTKAQEKKEDKPAGWDKEDEYLERAYSAKMKATPEVQKIGEDRVMYTCMKCKYKFKYNVATKTPPHCPYCGTGISRFGF